MQKRFKIYAFSLLALVTLLTVAFSASFVFANGHAAGLPNGKLAGSGKPVSAPMVSMHVVNMSNVPAVTPKSSSLHQKAMPFLTGVSATVYAQRKAAAAHNTKTPVGQHVYSNPIKGANTPIASTSFQGMADSASICPYFGGCQPPDMALATSKSFVFEGVNTSFAVYSASGALQSGWPKNAQNFFGVPNPGSCDTHGPFLSDPRAFYDSVDKRFWAAELQVEGAFGLNSCPFKSLYWIAVSQTGDPRGLWNVYAFDMALGTTNAADYTQFGFDGQAIYFSGNMFNQAGTAYSYAQILGAKKSTMEAGLSVSAFGFRFLSFGGISVDTVQPVEAQAAKGGGPRAGLFISSFDFNGDPFGDNCFSTSCVGYVVWALSNPGTSSTGLTAALASGARYIVPPNADEPGCSQCIETLDTRISATPVWHNGLISFALETGVNNGSQIVPSILWGQVFASLNDNGTLSSASVFQNGYLVYGGDSAASFGALMPDTDGNLFMVFEFMSSSTNPEVAYTARRVTFPLGSFHDGGFILRAGNAATSNSRWGDYEATSYDGTANNDVWFSGQYSAANHDWSTFIGKDKFSLTNP